MRALLTNPGFIVSLLVAVGVAMVFAVVFGASQLLFAILLILGMFAVLAEYALVQKQSHHRSESCERM